MSQASNYLSILNGCKNVVDGLGLTDWNSAKVPSIVLKKAAYRTGIDTVVKPPALYIARHPQGERVEPRVFGNTVWVWYPVDFLTIAPGDGDLSAYLDYYLNWRQQLRQAFQSPTLAGVSAVWDTNMKSGDILDPEAINKNYDVLLLTVEFRTSEQRLAT